jgi:3-hydroxyisobutyrate dehydrogenase-like beta-hydroxyacid dehydrogenase
LPKIAVISVLAMQRIALLGLGVMGGAMATNWLKKGFPLTVWNRTP